MTTHASAAQIMRELLEGPVTRSALVRWRRQQFLAKDGFGFYFGLFDSFPAARAWLPPNPEFNNDALATEYVEVRNPTGICQACGDECALHKAQHSQDCAAACRRCAEACLRMANR